MIKTKTVICDVMECTEYEERGIKSTLRDSKRNDIISEFNGVCYYDGKPIKHNVPFIMLDYPLYGLCIPENKFNLKVKFLIYFYTFFKSGILIDGKTFFELSPDKIGDKYLKVINDD